MNNNNSINSESIPYGDEERDIDDDDIENQKLLKKSSGDELSLLEGSDKDPVKGDREGDGYSGSVKIFNYKLNEKDKNSLRLLIKILTVSVMIGYLLSINIMYFVSKGRGIILYPTPSNSTDSGTTTPVTESNEVTQQTSSFNLPYFFYFSTLDTLLISYVNVLFWMLLLFTNSFQYHTITYIVSTITLVYSIIKSVMSAHVISQLSLESPLDVTLLPLDSPLYSSKTTRELTIAITIISSMLIVLCLVINSVTLIISYQAYREQQRKETLLYESKMQKSGKNTVVKHSNMKRLVAMAKPELPIILGAFIALILSSISSLALPLYFGEILTEVATTRDLAALNKSTLSLVIIFTFGSIATTIRSSLFYLAGQKFVARIRKDLFAAMVRQEVAFFDQNRTGELINRLASDSQVIQNSVTVNVSMAFRYSLQVIGCLILLFITNWKLTLLMLGIVPVLAIGTVFYGKKIKALGKEFQDELAKSSTTGEEVISNIRTVKAFSKEGKFIEVYGRDIHGSYLIGKTLAYLNGIFSGVVSLVAQLAITLIIYVGAKQVLSGQLETGNLMSFLLYTLTVAMSLAFLSSLFTDFMKAIGSSDRIFEIFDRIPAINTEGGIKLDESNVEGQIELANVDFTYPTRSQAVLEGINLTLHKGTVTALVGKSGGGKSTIVSLIERFYDPNTGVITLDGVNIKTLDPIWYRSILGFVSQEPLLFAGTIKENICFGKENASMEEIRDAAEKANALSFIETFDAKFDTVVGERGVRLSGGQKQRIAIARALLLNPKVLLLDEATSALDSESEHLVKEAIDRLMVDRTVLVIAHRLSTVINANVVVVIDKGRIAESGTHQELIQNEQGIYRNLVKRQLASN
ncbi:ABC transporter B family protein [Tieghemostelium lacteum]|uniref:ABC transporter B family protein n=1 Tax=Tieghemostelium lacteum TaxID=361077 RepID=A0A151ZHB5_TIELA|nr:ABC transporter B family protein [Tieghemostelium lacteum]|eukprot:KYQ93299.1 ABC transporter B family protein [Tieghemostelium lacteum]